jgi:hypothetical protein
MRQQGHRRALGGAGNITKQLLAPMIRQDLCQPEELIVMSKLDSDELTLVARWCDGVGGGTTGCHGGRSKDRLWL